MTDTFSEQSSNSNVFVSETKSQDESGLSLPSLPILKSEKSE